MNTNMQEKLAIKAVTDNRNDRKPPLDYTFMCLTSVKECLDEDPRGLIQVQKNDDKKASSEQVEKKKHDTTAIRLSNNLITEWSDFSQCISDIIIEPFKLEWIDLSFNDIYTIDKCILDYPNLKVLYLHGNAIDKISELDKLANLKYLKTLTLHGNPIEEDVSGYRQYVLSKLPQLKTFDFSAVTKQDRASAQTWNQMIKSKKGTKKK
ncbi:leucine-rich repeat-containing protein 51-like [Rhopilema esculentum]|uniref:leucine-rich repeat-containing protein 51-like n=1 Tax=Rhopilema esculentum TaxID=499914 RepID=UPI0031D0CFC4